MKTSKKAHTTNTTNAGNASAKAAKPATAKSTRASAPASVAATIRATTATAAAPIASASAASAAAASDASDDAFFADENDPVREARAQALEVIARLLIWIAEADGLRNRGIRATIALYCVRPDLIGGVTLEQIGDGAGISKQAAHNLAHAFRLGMGLVS